MRFGSTPRTLMVGLAMVAAALSCSPALAQVEPEALAVLEQSAEAINKVQSITFKATRHLEGNEQLKMRGDAEVKYIRNTQTPLSSLFSVIGTVTPPLDNHKLQVIAVFDGVNGFWPDEKGKIVYYKPAAHGAAIREVQQNRDQMIPRAYFQTAPYEVERRAIKINLEPNQKVDGVDCKVVNTTNGNDRATKFYIGATDGLPRRLEQITKMGTGQPDVSFTLDMYDINPDAKLTIKDLAFKDPEGWSRREHVGELKVRPDALQMKQQQEAIEQAAAGAAPNTPMMAPTDMAGLPAGTPAPAMSLRKAAGGQQTLDELKGQVVVLGFWGPLFGQSKPALETLEEINKNNAGKGVTVLGVAARSKDEAATKYFADHGYTFGLLLGGDEAAKALRVRGYPCTVVIGPDGKVIATFENVPAKADLAKAVSDGAAKK